MPTVIKQILKLAAALLLTMQIAVFFAKTWWFFELFTHYPHYFAITGTLLIPFLTWKQMWKTAIIMTAIIAINLAIISPYLEKSVHVHTSQPENLGPAPNLTILASNFYYKNTEYAEFASLITSEAPDIFIIHEATQAWHQEITPFQESYPYVQITQDTGINGIVLASSLPGTFQEIPLGSNVGLEFKPENLDLKILAVHPEAPITPSFAKERDAQFQDIITYSQESLVPIIVMGDFNCTPFSPHFQDLLTKATLKDARLGFGFIPTWHAHNPIFQIPIDHALVSHEIDVINFRTTEEITADHRPILAEIALP
jgi:endonuclease/exonuclease/phosphatase (EEP) superfamily protein YafD